MSPTTIIGLDLSLTGTGIAVCTRGDATSRIVWDVRKVATKGLTGTARLIVIRDAVRRELEVWNPAAVYLEGYAYGRHNKAAEIGELGGVIRVMLAEALVPWAPLAPKTVKKYATGKGNAEKDEVLAAAIRRLGYERASNDEADALWIAAVGHALHGKPVVDLPLTHLAALEGITRA